MANNILTPASRKVMDALAEFPVSKGAYGRELAGAAGLSPGSVYPILDKLEHAEMLLSEWEDIDVSEVGRPARRYWRFTARGAEVAREDLAARMAKLAAAQANMGWAT